MADERGPEGPSSNPADDSDIDAASEEEIDALLTEASDLAAEVGGEIGQPEDESPMPPPDTTSGAAPWTTGEAAPVTAGCDGLAGVDVEARLTELEGLLANTTEDIGDESGAVEEPASPPVPA